MYFPHPSSLLRRVRYSSRFSMAGFSSLLLANTNVVSRKQIDATPTTTIMMCSQQRHFLSNSRPHRQSFPHHQAALPSEKLGSLALSELRKEILRDEGEGAKSVVPQPPSGWRVVHEPRSRWLIMRKLRPSEMIRATKGDASLGADVTVTSAASTHQSLSGMQYKGHLNKGKPMTTAGGGSSTVSDNKRRGKIMNSFWSHSVPSASASPMDVEIYVPFATQDPSLFDNTLDVCEWQPFDVICSKAAGVEGGANHRHESAVVFHLAAVNSQLRVRGVQVLTPSAAREIGSADGSIGIFGGYGPSADYRRKLAYQGPVYSALSRELRACVEDFIAHDVGVDNLVLEYILQTIYISENEEYQRWLHELAVFSGGGSSDQ